MEPTETLLLGAASEFSDVWVNSFDELLAERVSE